MVRRRWLIGAVAMVLGVSTAAVAGGAFADTTPGNVPAGSTPPVSTYFSTVQIADRNSFARAGDGDLWANCWGADDNLYAAYGDGAGFGGPGSDIGVARIEGLPGALRGTNLQQGDGVGKIWSPGTNRKPTGMACVENSIYLAVQDLAFDFNDAPAATIVKSVDGGRTWTMRDDRNPMFGGGRFTTVMFLDYGRGYQNAPDPTYVYAYGLHHNWRDSFDSNNDPVDLFFARVPRTSVQDRGTWQFFTGLDAAGAPNWSPDLNAARAVLHDDRRLYPNRMFSNHINRTTPMSQGSVVYNKPLNRYIYSSWTEYTFEFYESPTPWGPWKRFVSKDFGGYNWDDGHHGGYATTIPSKFISADGRNMWIQSNVCGCGGGIPNSNQYGFQLRPMTVEPAVRASAQNGRDDGRNLGREAGSVPISRVAHFGNTAFWNDNNRGNSEDDWNDEAKTESWWGYEWPRPYSLNKVVYTTGRMFPDGGWFGGDLRVQVRRNGVWLDVEAQAVAPGYPYSSAAGANRSYTFTFAPTTGDAVRVTGRPGGTANFTSLGELEVYNAATGPAPAPATGNAAVVFGDQRHAFAVGTTGRLLHFVKDSATAAVRQETWPNGSLVGHPVAFAHGNQLHVFARTTTNALRHWWWSPGMPNPIDDLWAQAGEVTSNPTGFAAGDQQHVFFRGVDGSLQQRFYDISDGGAPKAGTWPGATIAGDPTAYLHGDQQHVFARTPDDALRHWWWMPGMPAGAPGTDLWAQAGQVKSNPAGFPVGDQQHAFFRGADGGLQHRFYDVSDGGTPQADGWAGQITGDPVAYTHDGEQHVFGRAADGATQHWFWAPGMGAAARDQWTTPAGPPASSWVAGFSVAGEQHLFYRSVDGTVAHRWYDRHLNRLSVENWGGATAP